MIKGDVIRALNKYWCVQHFACAFCESKLVANKSKFYDVDTKPCCKKCYEKFPRDVRKRLAEQHRKDKKAQQEQQKLEQQQAQQSAQQTNSNTLNQHNNTLNNNNNNHVINAEVRWVISSNKFNFVIN